MKVLVLDFDGVISDSAREAFLVARSAWEELEPDRPVTSGDALFQAFLEMMPLGNRAEDYGTAMAALAFGVSFSDQEAYDAFRADRDPTWLKAYHRRFYEVRARLREADPVAWRGLMSPYTPFVEVLRRRAGDVSYAIATSKDRASVDLLLRDYGIDDLFSPDAILDKETGEKKSAHLGLLRERRGLPYADFTFVDDKVNHLDTVARLGVRCALAGWGYNGDRERTLAMERGYLVCGLDDVEARLFGDS
jgi:phosphoglycolate phosphatase-like HAD superfamily hydrolase